MITRFELSEAARWLRLHEIGSRSKVRHSPASDTDNSNRTLMRDAAGNDVWSGPVVTGGIAFNIHRTHSCEVPAREEHRL